MTSEKPERIWAGQIADQMAIGYATRVWGDDPRVGTDEPATEYIRHDLHLAVLAEVERLREALERCPPSKPAEENDFVNRINTWWRLWARPALRNEEARKELGNG